MTRRTKQQKWEGRDTCLGGINQAGSSTLLYLPIPSLSTLSATILEAEGEDNASDHSLTLDMNFVIDLHESQRWMHLSSYCGQRATPPLTPWDSILESDMLITFLSMTQT